MPGLNADIDDDDEEFDLSYDNYSFGFHMLSEYNHAKKKTDIVDIIYNGRTRRFVILDSRGIWTWSSINGSLERHVMFPKYQSKLLKLILFCEMHHVYFAICCDFTLEVFNKDFVSTCKASDANVRSVLHIAYNAKTDELISAGMGGTTIWKYKQNAQTKFEKIQSKANYSLTQKSHHRDVGGSWCTKVVLLPQLQQVFFCSDNDVFVHSCDDLKLLFRMKKAHSASVTCVGFCPATKMLVTGSMDTEVKVWAATGGHIDTFRGHSQPVTGLVVNPLHSGLATTSSLDGTVKVWSLHVLELFYSLSVFSRGIDYMNFTNDNVLWCATEKKLAMYKFHPVAVFWGHARCNVASLHMTEEPRKTNRVLAAGEDGSVRMFSATSNSKVAICTAMPPPVSSATSLPLSVSYSRNNNLVFILISPSKIWVYTCKTDPACRIAEWNLTKMLSPASANEPDPSSMYSRPNILLAKPTMHKPVLNIMSFNLSYKCSSMAAIFSPRGFYFSGQSGLSVARSRDLLLLGMQDGRLLFMDQLLTGHKHFEIAVSKDAIHSIKYDHTTCRIYTCSGVSGSSIQVWALPGLEHVLRIDKIQNMTSFILFETFFASGHSNGSVEIISTPKYEPKQEHQFDAPFVDQPHVVSFRPSPRDKLSSQLYHKSLVIDVQACPRRSVLASCRYPPIDVMCTLHGDDGAVKIWGYDKVLMTEIWLDDSLTCCMFLNSHADLLVAWKNHIYVINRLTVLSQLTSSSDESEQSDLGSQIYEDPAMRSDNFFQPKTSEPIDMEHYLVPYDFVRDSLKGQDEREARSRQQQSDDVNDGSMEITENERRAVLRSLRLKPSRSTHESYSSCRLYQPNGSSTRSCHVIWSTRFTPSPTRYIHAPTELYRSPPESISPLLEFDSAGKLLHHNDWVFPEFGKSPNPTPTPSACSIESEEDVFVVEEPEEPVVVEEEKVSEESLPEEVIEEPTKLSKVISLVEYESIVKPVAEKTRKVDTDQVSKPAGKMEKAPAAELVVLKLKQQMDKKEEIPKQVQEFIVHFSNLKR